MRTTKSIQVKEEKNESCKGSTKNNSFENSYPLDCFIMQF